MKEWELALREMFWRKLAWVMPHDLVYWCGMRMWIHATTGPYSSQIVPELRVIDVG